MAPANDHSIVARDQVLTVVADEHVISSIRVDTALRHESMIGGRFWSFLGINDYPGAGASASAAPIREFFR